MRTVIDIPEADIPILDQLSAARHMSREELVSEAVSRYLQTQSAPAPSQEDRDEILERTFGLWAGHAEDGLAYQERMRSEWGR